MAELTRIQHRRDTGANWATNNPTLAAGVLGYDTTNKIVKCGDGATAWNDLLALNKISGMIDASLSGLADGNILVYSTAATKWVNQAPATTHTQNTDTGTTQTSFAVDSGGTGFRLKNSSGECQIRNLADNAYGDFRCKNLYVTGTTTTINSETMTVDDNIIVLNNNVTGAPSENAGIEIERGSSTNASMIWDETADKWKCGLAGSETEISLVGHTHSYVLTTDYEDSDVLTKIKNVDGTGSGLDADLLDGHEATYFIAAPGSPEQGDILYYTGSAWASLPHGTAKQVLLTGGHSANPAWGDIDGGSA